MSLSTPLLVSIIIPYFNCHKYIKETLNSAIIQNYKDIEIIVVNDGSDDKNTAFLENLLKEHPNVIYRYQNNQGVSSARNTGAMMATGDFLLFLDADDKIAPTYVEKALAYLSAHPDCKVVYSRAEFFEEQTGEWQLPEYVDFRDLLIANKILTSALHRRTDFLRISGFDANLATYEDWDYWIRLLKDGGSVKRLDEILIFHRERQDHSSLTDDLLSNVIKNRTAWQKVCQKHSDVYIEHHLSYLDFFETLQQLERQKTQIKNLLNNEQQLKKISDYLTSEVDAIKTHNNTLAHQNKALIEHNHTLETKLHHFKRLWLIKLLKPFIKLEQGLHSLNRYRKAFRILMREKGSFGKAYQTVRRYYKENGFQKTKYFLRSYLSSKP